MKAFHLNVLPEYQNFKNKRKTEVYRIPGQFGPRKWLLKPNLKRHTEDISIQEDSLYRLCDLRMSSLFMREIGHATYQRDIETSKPVQYKHQQKNKKSQKKLLKNSFDFFSLPTDNFTGS